MRDLFISDIHLTAEKPEITQAFVAFLRSKTESCRNLYLLGDIFEAWLGDDLILENTQYILSEIKKLSDKGISVFFQHGNRDFLVSDRFSDITGAHILKDEAIITLPDGQVALLMHGDQLCTDDLEYQQFRQMVRQPLWQQHFLQKQPEERIAIARQLREASQMRNQQKTEEIMDVNDQAVAEALSRHQCSLLIHGHTHRPQVHHNHHSVRYVLGDWGPDVWYIEADTDGLQLKHYPFNPQKGH